MSDDMDETLAGSAESDRRRPEVEHGGPSEVTEALHTGIAGFFAEATSDGLFPAVAFGLDPNGAPSTVGVLTTPITDFPVSLQIVERVCHETVTPYRFVPLQRLKYIGDKNAIMRLALREIPSLDTKRPEHRKAVSRIMAYCTASRWKSRAFALVDMAGFSLCSTPEQLSLRMSLGQAINTCLRRMYPLSISEVIPEASIRGFNRISTGDGFYIWNFDGSADGHVALFLLLVLLMGQTRALHEGSGSPLELRAAFAIGEAYTFPYHGPGIPPSGAYHGFMPDAIGPVLNQLQRFLAAAAPGQILVAPFDEPGRENRPNERLNVETMLTRIRSEILPAELGPDDAVKSHDIELRLDPNTELRVTDKHEQVHHCYNVCGSIPHRPTGSKLSLQRVGLVTDSSEELTERRFRTT